MLGRVTNGPYYEMKMHSDCGVLNPDTLLRISYLLRIFETLNVIHDQPLSDEWVTRPNSNRIFGGGTPLTYMIRGDLPAMSVVRRLLDARQVGL